MTLLHLLLDKFDTFNCLSNIVLSLPLFFLRCNRFSHLTNWCGFFFDINFLFHNFFNFYNFLNFYNLLDYPLHYLLNNLRRRRLCSSDYLLFCEFISQQIGHFFVNIFTCFLKCAYLLYFLLSRQFCGVFCDRIKYGQI